MPRIIEWEETSDSLGFSMGQDGNTSADRSFRVRFDAPQKDVRVIYSDSRFPKPFSKHPYVPGAYAQSPSGRARYNARLWEITVPYSTELIEEEQDPNPLARPARVSWGDQSEKIPTVVDGEGNYYLNTAGDLMLGETRDKVLWEISVSKNVTSVPSEVRRYRRCTNSDSVKIDGDTFDINTLLLAGLSVSDYQQENNKRFRQMTMRFLLDEDGWVEERPSRGFRELVTRRVTRPGEFFGKDRKTLIPIVDKNGKQIDEPAFLDKDGKAYRDKHGNIRGLGDSQDALKPSEIIVLKFKPYPSKPFSDLPLK